MVQVTYNANGASAGSAPTDSTNYAVGATVTVLGNTGGLSKPGQTFAYWNTAQNGSGTVFTGGATFAINANITLFAQWFTTAGLTVTAPHTTPGVTDQYAIAYDASLAAANGVNRANALIGSCDADFAQMNALFGNVGTPFSAPIQVNLSAGPWASASWGPPITVTPGNGSKGDLVRYLLVSEVVEMFMQQLGSGWGYSYGDTTEGSKGEALSRFLGYYFLATNALDLTILKKGGGTFFVANNWLGASPRPDFVNNDPDDNNPDVTTGCTTLFVYYLYDQLKFPIPNIINAGAATLAGVYRNLTGDTGDPFPFFARLMNGAFPGTNTISKGPNFDDPFPIGLLSFWSNNNTLSRDQVKDIVATQGGVVWNAFYLVLEGFSINSFNAYNVQVPTPSFSPGLSGVSIRPSPIGPGQPVPAQPTPIFEHPANPKAPQRIRFSFDLVFTDESAFPNPGDAPVTAVFNAKAQVGGADLPGASCAAGFELLGGANPYFSNVDPSNAADLAYLSQDLRVFRVVEGEAPMIGAPAFTSDGYASIQAFLQWLNGNSQYTTPTGPNLSDPLNELPGQTGYETADSSVTPTNSTGTKTYNFALARVRLRGLGGDSADRCRVFFRLFVAQSCDTDFQPATTYKSTLGTSGADNGHPVAPLASASGLSDPSGQALQTIPFFATDISGTHDYDGTNANANIRNVTIPAGGDQVWAYYGCFLDIYDSAGNARNLAGTHHCLAAEIAYSLAPIPTTTATGAAPNPLIWDQLAQRNLQITLSENPKSRATHIVGQAFDIRPSRPLTPLPGAPLDLPDELMIDWGRTPPDSEALIYWPGLDAYKVLVLAEQSYASHLLYAVDAHTIGCKTTAGVTYIPIPHASGVNFAGLLQIDLPSSIHHGQVFEVLVRRVSTRQGRLRPPPPPPPPGPHIAPQSARAKARAKVVSPAAEREGTAFTWRQILGAFTVRIPVTHKDVMLPIEEDTLAVLRWRYQQAHPLYRWRPVWERLIHLTERRVEGLGGDPSRIPPSLGGYRGHRPRPGTGEPGHRGHHDRREERRDRSATGKIDGIVYDRFGDFAGFSLRDEHGREHHYRAREAAIERLALEAWRERWVVTAVADAEGRHHHHHGPHGTDTDWSWRDEAPCWCAALILRRRN